MGIITIEIAARGNQPPSSIGWVEIDVLNAASHFFTEANFTTETTPQYSDPEEDDIHSIKITSLPSAGTLELDGVLVTVNQEILASDLDGSSFAYITDALITNSHSDEFSFSASDVGSNEFTLSSELVYINVAAEITNQAPSLVGGGTEDILVGETFTFTEASLTTDLSPEYTDPEGDNPLKLLVTSLPVYGRLELDGAPVVSGQEIAWQDILDGKFKYINESIGENPESFDFEIADSGSGQYTG